MKMKSINITAIFALGILVTSCKKEDQIAVDFAKNDKEFSNSETERISKLFLDKDQSTIVNHHKIQNNKDEYVFMSAKFSNEENIKFKFGNEELSCNKQTQDGCFISTDWQGFDKYFGAKNKFEIISNSGNKTYEAYIPQELEVSYPDPFGPIQSISDGSKVKWNEDKKNESGVLIEYVLFDSSDPMTKQALSSGHRIIKDDGEFDASVLFSNKNVKSVDVYVRRGNIFGFNLSNGNLMAFQFLSSKAISFTK